MRIRITGLLLFIFLSSSAFAQNFTAAGGSKDVYTEEGYASTGLKNIFLFYGMTDARLTYISPNSGSILTWYRYKDDPNNLEKLSGTQTDNETILTTIESGYGYVVNDSIIGISSKNYAVWAIDFILYRAVFDELKVIEVENEDKCLNTSLQLSGNIPDIDYCSFVDGSRQRLVRTFKIAYQTLKWNGFEDGYEEISDTVKTLNDESPFKVNTPLTNTDFKLWESKYAEYFEEDAFVVSDEYEAVKVEVHAQATTTVRDTSNEKNPPKSTSSYEGSAPLEIVFTSYPSDAVRHFSWEFSSREDFSVLMASYPEEELHYTFDRTGKYYVRLNVSDYNNNCSEVAPEIFTISVSESFIEAPNYFTPNSSTDVNDEFKVSYQSINKFKCSIFNRWGILVYEYYDPALGWDGKKDGKLVPPGVYFYVIEADGSDGVKHKLKGDINLLYKK